MELVLGLSLAAVTLVAWLGQALSWRRPDLAERLSLTESAEAVEPAYHAWIRGEAIWDTIALWPLVVAGVLLAAGSDVWPYFALFGSGSFVYFAGLAIVTRLVMTRRGFRVGDPDDLKTAYVALALWGAVATAAGIGAVFSLAG